MSELIPKNRLPNLGETVIDVIATTPEDEPTLGSVARCACVETVAAVEQDDERGAATELVVLVRSRLEQHPHFRGRSYLFNIELVGETIVMTGHFPSFYLKQLLQEVIRVTPGVICMDNQVHVVWPNP
ncbi:MAG: hypothetical protein ACYC6N_20755 [Pirellulaceae bacterium]